MCLPSCVGTFAYKMVAWSSKCEAHYRSCPGIVWCKQCHLVITRRFVLRVHQLLSRPAAQLERDWVGGSANSFQKSRFLGDGYVSTTLNGNAYGFGWILIANGIRMEDLFITFKKETNVLSLRPKFNIKPIDVYKWTIHLSGTRCNTLVHVYHTP